MAPPLRIAFDGALYHVPARGNARKSADTSGDLKMHGTRPDPIGYLELFFSDTPSACGGVV